MNPSLIDNQCDSQESFMTDLAHRPEIAPDLSPPMNPVPSEPNRRIAPPRLVEHYALRPDAVLAASPATAMSLRSGR